MIRKLLATVVLIFCTAAPARAASVPLAWDPSSSRTVAGYKIHYGTESGKYTQTIQVQGRLNSKAVVDNLEEGKTYFFSITSYDKNGKESAYSNEISSDPELNRKKNRAGETKIQARPPQASNVVPQGTNEAANGETPDRQKLKPSRSMATSPDGKILPTR